MLDFVFVVYFVCALYCHVGAPCVCSQLKLAVIARKREGELADALTRQGGDAAAALPSAPSSNGSITSACSSTEEGRFAKAGFSAHEGEVCVAAPRLPPPLPRAVVRAAALRMAVAGSGDGLAAAAEALQVALQRALECACVSVILRHTFDRFLSFKRPCAHKPSLVSSVFTLTIILHHVVISSPR